MYIYSYTGTDRLMLDAEQTDMRRTRFVLEQKHLLYVYERDSIIIDCCQNIYAPILNQTSNMIILNFKLFRFFKHYKLHASFNFATI